MGVITSQVIIWPNLSLTGQDNIIRERETQSHVQKLAGAYYSAFVFLRQMMDHHTNMLPQLIHDPKMLGLVQSFLM